MRLRRTDDEEDDSDEHAADRVAHALAEGLVRDTRVAGDGWSGAHGRRATGWLLQACSFSMQVSNLGGLNCTTV